MTIAANAVKLAYDGPLVLDGVSVQITPGSITALLGPNGCGKSTLLRALARILQPRSGTVLLDGQDIFRQPTHAVAQRLSYLPQNPSAPAGLSVGELVAMGRYPHRRAFGGDTAADAAAIQQALAATDLSALAGHELDALSGGQRQRAWIAMALCQGAEILLLDEPTNHLDLAHQIEVLDLLRRLVQAGRTVLIVLHDLHLAARYADWLLVLSAGRIAAQGTPVEVIAPEMLRRVFAIEAEVIHDPECGTPLVLPRGLAVKR